MTVRQPNTELVAQALLAKIYGISRYIGTTLPEDNSTWAASGFTTVSAVGGSASIYVPMMNPVVTLNFWARKINSPKPSWGQANNLAETVRRALYHPETLAGRLDLPAGYPDVQFYTAFFVGEPRRIPGDPSGYARYTADMQVNWAPVTN